MKIMIKKQQHLLMLSISLSLGAIAILNAVQQESAVSVDNAIKTNQYAIIGVGKTSWGQNPITGRACIVMKRKELKKICKGDIVITPAIHSTWYAELSLAGAIIIEKQDDSSHARGYGKKLEIPIIVGVEDATKKIVDGQTIMCDPVTHTIYHVAYPEHILGLIFDKLPLEAQVSSGQSFYHIPVNQNKIISSKNMHNNGIDYYIPSKLDDIAGDIESEFEYKASRKRRVTKDVYLKHFNQFKKFALDIQKQYKRGKWWGLLEVGARATGRDQFSIDCMPIGDILLDSDEKHFIEVLQRLDNEKYIDYMDRLIEQCIQRPKNISEANWVSRVSHKEHIRSVHLPEEIDKEELIEHPKEYKKVESKVSKEEREALIAAGLFALYGVENKLSF